MPSTSLLTRQAVESRSSSWRGFALLLILLAGLGGFAIQLVAKAEIQRAEQRFDAETQSIVDSVKRKLHANEAVLSGFVAFLQAVDSHDLESTRRYAQAAMSPFDHIYMLEVARRVAPEEVETFESGIRENKRPGFRIRSFSEVTQRQLPQQNDSTALWPVVFMHPQIAATENIYGVDLATVPHVNTILSAATATSLAWTSPVFEMFEGGRAYILLQSVDRTAKTRPREKPNYFGNQMVALILVRITALLPENIDDRLMISLQVGDVPEVGSELLTPVREVDKNNTATFWLPEFSRTVSSGSPAQPLQLTITRQLHWRDFANSGFLQLMLGICVALVMAGLNIRQQISSMHQTAEAHERAEHQAMHDPLTGLPNRLLLADRAHQAIHRWERNGSNFAVIQIDLDYFKEINDRYSHEAGDRVLNITAARMAMQLRGSDTIARTGGDEFIVILSDILNADDAAVVAEKIRLAVAEPIVVGRHRISITCSLGISLCPDDGIDFNTLHQIADQAMYEAKGCGRNTVTLARG